jgi:hypothetical protein
LGEPPSLVRSFASLENAERPNAKRSTAALIIVGSGLFRNECTFLHLEAWASDPAGGSIVILLLPLGTSEGCI